VLLKAMPKMLGEGGQRSVKEEIRDLLEGMTSKTWKGNRDRALELLAAL
jgi:hypothetical protein